MYYTLEKLRKENQSRIEKIDNSTVEKINKIIEVISKKTEISAGDIVEYTSKYGDYFEYAHIEKIENNQLYICENGTPHIFDENNYSTSGGAWSHIPKNLKLVGRKKRKYWTWGTHGACGNGGVYFEIERNVWEYNCNEKLHSTKTHKKDYISYNAKKEHSNNIWFGDGFAFKNDIELMQYLHEGVAEIEKGYWENQLIIWTWKTEKKAS